MVNSTGQIGLPPIQVSPLGYTGSPLNFVPITSGPRDPTGLDVNYVTGTEWTNTVSLAVWKLLGFINGVAQWINITSGTVPPGVLLSLSDTANTKTYPDAFGNIQIFGANGIDVTADTPGPFQMTIGLSGTGAIATITGDDGTPESPSANNFNILGLVVANGTNTQPVWVQGSAATETVEVQQAKAVTPTPVDNNDIGLASFSDAQFAVDSTSGMVTLLGGANPAVQGLIPDTGSNVTADPATGLIKVEAVNPSGTVNPQLPTQGIAAHTFGVCAVNCAKWIVDPTAGVGTHQTIVAAMAAASSGDTIFIRPGTYSGALTLKAGVNLSAFPCDAYTPNVTISGNVTASYNGNVSCSGINFKAAAGVSIACSGASSSLLDLVDCTVTASAGTGITVNDATFVVGLDHCLLGATAGNACFSITLGFITARRSTINGADGTANTVAGTLNAFQCDFGINITTSGAGTINLFQCTINNSSNYICVTTAGTGISITSNCYYNAGTASGLSIGAGTVLFVMNSTVVSSNANAIDGAGTLKYGYIVFGGASSTINAGVTKTALTVI